MNITLTVLFLVTQTNQKHFKNFNGKYLFSYKEAVARKGKRYKNRIIYCQIGVIFVYCQIGVIFVYKIEKTETKFS